MKRLVRLFDSSPSKMTQGKKAVTSATALAQMAGELGREEAAASSVLVAQAADKFSMDMLAAFDSSILAAKKSDSDLMARGGGQQKRHLKKEEQPPALGWQL